LRLNGLGRPEYERHAASWPLRADGLCRARNLPFSAHCAPQVSAHLCCAMEKAVHVEYFHDHERIESMLFEGALPLEDGRLRPDPSRPGLGIELRAEEARRFRRTQLPESANG